LQLTAITKNIMAEISSEFNWLRKKGYRLTPQRIAILETLKQAKGHLTPTEIYHQVVQELPGLTEPTVYRTLNFLAEQGLVLVAHLGRGQLVYEFAEHDHHHLVCRNCGEMQEIDHLQLKQLYDNFLEDTGYQINTVHATFFGYCPKCIENGMVDPK
jgi:Fur family ferric uptake transcriptional regulator